MNEHPATRALREVRHLLNQMQAEARRPDPSPATIAGLADEAIANWRDAARAVGVEY